MVLDSNLNLLLQSVYFSFKIWKTGTYEGFRILFVFDKIDGVFKQRSTIV